MATNQNLAQIFETNPITTIGDTDILYAAQGGTTDAAIDGTSLKAQFASSTAPISWVPVVDFLTQGDLTVAYTIQVGNYVQVGRLVIATYQVTFTLTYTTASGSFFISLPISPANNAFNGVNYSGITLASGYDSVIGNAQNDGNFYIYMNGSGQIRQAMSVTQLTSGNQYSMYGTVTYMI